MRAKRELTCARSPVITHIYEHTTKKNKTKQPIEKRTWSSPRSRPSVPSTSITIKLRPLPRHIQIPVGNHITQQLASLAN